MPSHSRVFVSQSFTPPQFSLGLFYLISACIGLPMAVLPFRFSGSSIVSSALITAATFFALSIFAITTKRNLGWLGNFLFCGLTALLLMSIGNLFFASAHLMTALNIASVILFSGYIAFDTQLAVQKHNDRSNCSDLYDVAEDALNIYLDIVNLFVNLLFLVAGEKN
nr:Bax inhibitor-1 family protein [Acetobacter malorum]